MNLQLQADGAMGLGNESPTQYYAFLNDPELLLGSKLLLQINATHSCKHARRKES